MVFLTLILRSLPQVGFTRLVNLMSISGRPEIDGGVSKDEGEENTRKRASLSFETRAAHAPQDEEARHPIALREI